jgi:16S rRNA (guanine1207-N2)-methyltransferase
MPVNDDAPLRSLMLPFASGALAWPEDGALFLHAQDGAPLRQLPTPGLVVEQGYKPEADALHAAGYASGEENDTQRHPLVLLLPPRQREAMRALFARAFERCRDGGMVVASVANDAGAKSAERDFRALAGAGSGLSKHHCRVFWARKEATTLDAALLAQWRGLDAPRRIAAPQLPGGCFLSRPGVFAWDRIDPASALLAAHLPGGSGSGAGQGLQGAAADLGGGWGYLSIELLRRNPGIRALDLYEADARALELARANLAAAGTDAALDFLWHDVAAGLPRRYDVIVTNPPFHAQDRADRPELGQRFIAVAAQALRPGGRLYLVANRHLPYEDALRTHFGAMRVLAQQGGFKAVEAVRSAR